jgi:hypothetical protein
MSTPLFPTLNSECNDTERRSLQKINELLYQNAVLLNNLASLITIAQGGSSEFVYSVTWSLPPGADLYDLSVYNQTDADLWVMVFLSPTVPSNGQQPQFQIRAYAHNHAYLETSVKANKIPGGRVLYVYVSSAESVLAINSTPVYMAIRHS